MKKIRILYIILFFVIIAGLVTFLVKKDDDAPSLSEQIDERLSAYTTDLEDSIVSFCDNKDVVQYLLNWAGSKGISCDVLNNTTVIFDIRNSKTASTVNKDYLVVCEYDPADMSECVDPISVSLAIAKSAAKDSPLKILFTPREKSDKLVFQQILSGLLSSNSQIICLGKSSENLISISTGGWNSQSICKDIQFVKPEFNKAYRISISGLPELYYSEDTVMQPNPIKTLGNLLAHFVSSQKLCELAEINGNSNLNCTVGGASATIVFDEEAADSFNEELDSYIESFLKKYENDYPDLLFNYEEVACPESVVSVEDCEDIVGFLYSVTDGEYKRDNDGQILAMSNIDNITLDTSSFSVDISTYGYSRESMEELTESNSTFASLLGLSFNQNICAPIYDGNIISDTFMELLHESSKEYGPKLSFSMEPTSNLTRCSFIFENYGNLPMLYVSFNDEGKSSLCEKIVMIVSKTTANNT